MMSRVEILSPTVEARYWSYVDIRGDDECWPWTGTRERYGHGALYIGRSATGRCIHAKAHRLAYEYDRGEPPPDDLRVRHTCDNPPCQNPRHLLLGTQGDNIRDMYDRGRNVNVSRPGVKHPMSKITEEQAVEIIDRRAHGATYYQMAREYGISQSQVRRIARGEGWKHLTTKGT